MTSALDSTNGTKLDLADAAPHAVRFGYDKHAGSIARAVTGAVSREGLAGSTILMTDVPTSPFAGFQQKVARGSR
jgi:hypothetical protein